MSLNQNIRIQSIVDRFPSTARIFGWYDIDVTDDDVRNLSIENACDRFQIELEDLVLDLEEALNEERNANWLNDGDSWTAQFTEEASIETEPTYEVDDDTIEEGSNFDETDELDL